MAETIAPTPDVAKRPGHKPDTHGAAPAEQAKPVAPTPEVAKEDGRKADPDGVAPAGKAARDEPKGLPNSDRHEMETAVAKQS